MLLRNDVLQRIRDGTITVAFRRWRRPTVRAGGTLLTPVGQLGIRAVDPVSLNQISFEDARRAGYESVAALLNDLRRVGEGTVYRITLGRLRPDPRIELRQSAQLTDRERRDVVERLRRLDARAPDGPWTRRVLELITAHPGLRAGDLCALAGQEKETFKQRVRKLKGMGLTESLDVGYRLSPRGARVLEIVRLGKSTT
ncbi:MAG: hypothetical protein ACRD26_23800 [Vicinamibacterales bacterium]